MQAPCVFIEQQIAAKVLRQLCSEIAAKTELQRWSQKQEWSKIWEHLWWQLESLFPQIYQTFCLSRVNYGLIPLSILARFSSFRLWFFCLVLSTLVGLLDIKIGKMFSVIFLIFSFGQDKRQFKSSSIFIVAQITTFSIEKLYKISHTLY